MVSIIIPTTKITPSNYALVDALKDLDYEVIIQGDPKHKGKGWALQEGFKKTKGDRIVWLDADLQISPKHIKKFLEVDADIVVSSKLHPLSKLHYIFGRKMVTFLSCLVQRLLFNLPLRDTQTGLKVFKRKVLERNWQVKGFGHDIEVLVKAYHEGKTIVEMPVQISVQGKTTVSLKGIIKTLYEMLWLKWALIKRR